MLIYHLPRDFRTPSSARGFGKFRSFSRLASVRSLVRYPRHCRADDAAGPADHLAVAGLACRLDAAVDRPGAIGLAGRPGGFGPGPAGLACLPFELLFVL